MIYHKINSIFKRRMDTKEKLFILGDFADPAVEYLKDNEWEFTEKIDGTNIRVMFDGETIKFGGKTDNAQLPVPLYEHLDTTFKPKLELFKETFTNLDGVKVILFGEGCGWKIQKGGMGYVNNEKRQDFILFDVRIGDWFLKREDVEGIAGKFDVRVVPVVGCGTIGDAIEIVSGGTISTYGNFIMEGLVLRPKVELKDRSGKRIITKIKYRDFKHLQEVKEEIDG